MNQAIKLEMLYYFVVLAETRHFSLAADKLFITQQALSKSIRQLEDKIGTPLFDRNSKSQFITPAGRKLQQHAYRILAKTRLVEMQYHSQAALAVQARLRIGHCNFFDERIYILLKQLIRKHDDIFVSLTSLDSPSDCEAMLLAHEIDVGISLMPSTSERLNCKTLQKLEFVIVGHPDMPFQKWHELDYIRHEGSGDAFSMMFDWPEEQFSRRIVAEADLNTGLSLCELGVGAFYLFKEGVLNELSNRSLKVVSRPPFYRELNVYLLWRMDEAETSVICAMIQDLVSEPR